MKYKPKERETKSEEIFDLLLIESKLIAQKLEKNPVLRNKARFKDLFKSIIDISKKEHFPDEMKELSVITTKEKLLKLYKQLSEVPESLKTYSILVDMFLETTQAE